MKVFYLELIEYDYHYIHNTYEPLLDKIYLSKSIAEEAAKTELIRLNKQAYDKMVAANYSANFTPFDPSYGYGTYEGRHIYVKESELV